MRLMRGRSMESEVELQPASTLLLCRNQQTLPYRTNPFDLVQSCDIRSVKCCL